MAIRTVTPPRRKLGIRWLLQMDQPVAERSEAELLAEMHQHYHWNFTVNLLDGAFFWFGLSFISSTTILPLFVSKISDSSFALALLAVLGQASWYLPQIFMAGFTERVARKKLMVVYLGLLTERLPTWLLPLAALLALHYPGAALWLFLVAYAIYGLGAGMIAPAWSDMIARCFPVERRGWFFGFTSFVGTGLGALGAIFGSWILEQHPFPANFFWSFLVAAAAITFSWVFIAQTREPVQAVAPAVLANRRPSWQRIIQIVRGDKNFRHFLLVRLLGNFGNMGAGFLTVAAIQRWDLEDGAVAFFTIALMAGQTLGTLLAGILADRYGHKLSLTTGFAGYAVTFLLAWGAVTPFWYYFVFLSAGMATGLMIVSGVLIAMEFSLSAHRPTYVGIANTAHGVGSALAPLAGGLVALAGYRWLFGVSACLALAAMLWLIWVVRDPRWQREFFEPMVG